MHLSGASTAQRSYGKHLVSLQWLNLSDACMHKARTVIIKQHTLQKWQTPTDTNRNQEKQQRQQRTTTEQKTNRDKQRQTKTMMDQEKQTLQQRTTTEQSKDTLRQTDTMHTCTYEFMQRCLDRVTWIHAHMHICTHSHMHWCTHSHIRGTNLFYLSGCLGSSAGVLFRANNVWANTNAHCRSSTLQIIYRLGPREPLPSTGNSGHSSSSGSTVVLEFRCCPEREHLHYLLVEG